MSADMMDNASDVEALFNRATIDNARAANRPIHGSHACLWCREPLVQNATVPRRWCDAECRDLWELANR